MKLLTAPAPAPALPAATATARGGTGGAKKSRRTVVRNGPGRPSEAANVRAEQDQS